MTTTAAGKEADRLRHTYDAWLAQEEGRTRGETRILYDARIAPPDTDMSNPESLRASLEWVYGDCDWKRPKPKAPTPDDRLAQKLLDVNKWVAEHGSEPTADGGLKEKLLAASLKALRTKATDSLRQYDEYHLLG